jgi:helix-turn-helix protein
MREQILALRAQGKSYREIEKELGCSKGTIAYHCSDGQKEKTVERAKQRRINQFAEIAKLKDVPCADCGNKFPPECMDFDHVSGDKIGQVAHLVTCRGFQVALDEIEKCEVVCANCHRTRTKNRGRAGWNRKIL